MKYKNKDGIELSYDNHDKDAHVQLVKEVIREALRIGDDLSWDEAKKFLKCNFSIGDKHGT
jgi:hypothetical protein